MKRTEWSRCVACVVIAALVIVGGAVAASAANLRKIVVFVEGTSRKVQDQVIEKSGSRVLNVLSLINGVAIQLPAEGTEKALSTLRAEPTVEAVYDDPTIAVQGAVSIGVDGIAGFIQPVPEPKRELYPWGLDRISVPYIHEDQPQVAGSGIDVAILDTGIDRNHPDLKTAIVSCINARAGEEQSNCQDDNGHGTHIAGIIAAQSNQKGVIGAAPQSRLHVIKVLDKNGAGQVSDLISGLGWVPVKKIELLNMSLGFPQEWGCPPEAPAGSAQCPYPYPVLARAIKRLYDAGVIMVAAAGNRNPRPLPIAQGNGGDGNGGDGNGGDGNGGDGSCSTGQSLPPDEKTAQGNGGDSPALYCYKTTKVKAPAAYPWLIAVGATDAQDRVANYSRSGPEMAHHGVTAPGGLLQRDKAGVLVIEEGILSTTIGGGYGVGNGTSQAAAHVTGALALMLTHKRGLPFKDVHALLMRRGRSYGLPPEWEGGGLIDAERMVNALKRGRW